MPFKPNDELTKKWAKMGARKGLELEIAQQNEMTELFSNYLILASKISNGSELNEKEMRAYEKLEKLVLKAMDKLHASKSEMDVKGEITSKVVILDL